MNVAGSNCPDAPADPYALVPAELRGSILFEQLAYTHTKSKQTLTNRLLKHTTVTTLTCGQLPNIFVGNVVLRTVFFKCNQNSKTAIDIICLQYHTRIIFGLVDVCMSDYFQLVS